MVSPEISLVAETVQPAAGGHGGRNQSVSLWRALWVPVSCVCLSRRDRPPWLRRWDAAAKGNNLALVTSQSSVLRKLLLCALGSLLETAIGSMGLMEAGTDPWLVSMLEGEPGESGGWMVSLEICSMGIWRGSRAKSLVLHQVSHF